MKIWTLWHRGDEGMMPWLLDSYDEYTLEENGEVPPSYQANVDKYAKDARELVLEIPDGAVRRIFEPATLDRSRVGIWTSPEAAATSRGPAQKQEEDDGA